MKKPKKALLAKIRLLVLDVDGTLTDGRLYYGKEGEALKAFDVRDGHGLRLLSMHAGVKLAVLTGRNPELIQKRCKELAIEHVVGSSRAKGAAIEQICKDLGIPLAATAYVGDDVNDLPALRRVALSFAPADAAPEVQKQVDYVTSHKAGRGAVREICELLLAAHPAGWPPEDDA